MSDFVSDFDRVVIHANDSAAQFRLVTIKADLGPLLCIYQISFEIHRWLSIV
jgi:hypothetical protein